MEDPYSLEHGVPSARLQCGCSRRGADHDIHSSPQVRLGRDKGGVGSGGNVNSDCLALAKGSRALRLDLGQVAAATGTLSFAYIAEIGRNHYIIA